MATAPITKPISMLPESPRKIRAGGKLKRRKPASAPASEIDTNPNERLPVKQDIQVNVPQITNPTVDAKPSNPSSMLTAFMEPTNHTRVRAMPNQPSSKVYPKNQIRF